MSDIKELKKQLYYSAVKGIDKVNDRFINQLEEIKALAEENNLSKDEVMGEINKAQSTALYTSIVGLIPEMLEKYHEWLQEHFVLTPKE
ncbi:hypothetical protein [uncultured Brevibacillus sp.]|uniref:hypothetical protein n=1 Tax=uncultured Brevibacillus sp. TaxID=169970 RepID=UPI002594C876|nr:hypothetical protein [uncultured Brevibacillus sp.]